MEAAHTWADTPREQCLDWCEEGPADVNCFNRSLVTWLLWYNTERPHRSLGRLPPLRYLLNTVANWGRQSNMWWTHTKSCAVGDAVVR